MKTVYDHIKSNNIKSLTLVLLFPLVFIGLIFLFVLVALVALGETAAVAVSESLVVTTAVAIPVSIISLLWMFISWAFGDSMMLSMAGASQIHKDEKKYRELFRMVENVSLAAGLPVPRVYIIDDYGMNAFATGRGPKDASVAFTVGIIDGLDKNELEGVIAHEMAHVGNRDIRMDMLIITGLGVTFFVADLLFRMAGFGDRDGDKDSGKLWAIIMAVWLAFVVFNFFISPVLRMAISRRREYLADATGALITRNPRALASALAKISKDSHVEAVENSHTMAGAFIANPCKGISGLFATHPPIDDRIKRLRDMG